MTDAVVSQSENTKAEAAKREKKARHRSPNYPAIGLRSAAEKIAAIYAQDGLAPSLKIAALKHMGFDKAHGEAGRVLSALKSFGLIEETTDDRVKLTQQGIDIVARPEGDELRASALWNAAIGPEIYRELLKQYKDSGLPSDTALKSELLAVKKFNPNAVQDFLRDFRDTLDFAGISDIRLINWDLEAQDVTPEPEIRPPTKVRSSLPMSPVPSAGTPPPPGRQPGAKSNMQQDVFTLAEGPVTIQWPESLSLESYEDLRDWLDIMKRKIGRSSTPVLEQCLEGCCFFINGTPVTSGEYTDAKERRISSLGAGVEPGKRGLKIETLIACRKQK